MTKSNFQQTNEPSFWISHGTSDYISEWRAYGDIFGVLFPQRKAPACQLWQMRAWFWQKEQVSPTCLTSVIILYYVSRSLATCSIDAALRSLHLHNPIVIVPARCFDKEGRGGERSKDDSEIL
jgi:hypothetical protein